MASGRKPPGPDNQDFFGSGTFDPNDVAGGGAAFSLEAEQDALADKQADSLGAIAFDVAPTDDFDVFESGNKNALSQAAEDASPRRAAARREWPTGVTPDPAAMTIDVVDVRLTADYGPSPANIALAVPYAIKVLQRKRVLGAKVKELGARLAAAEKERDGMLVGLAQELRGKILMREEGEKVFERVVEIERLALERRSALAGTNAEYDRRAKELDATIAEAKQALGAKQAVVQQLGGELSQQQRTLERVEAKRKRAYIELRGIVDVTEKGGQLTPQQAARMPQLEAEIASLKPEVEAATAATRAAEAKVSAANAEVQAAARRTREAERARKALDQEFQKQIGARSEGVSEVETHRDAALLDVGRAVLGARGRLVDLPEDVVDRLMRVEASVRDRAVELEKYVRALHAHDATALRNGLAVIGAAVLVLIVVIFVAAS